MSMGVRPGLRVGAWTTYVLGAALVSTSVACLAHQKGDEQGQLAWLAAGLDTEFPERSPGRDLAVKPTPASSSSSAVAAATTPEAFASAATLRPRPNDTHAIDDPANASVRPILRVVGAGKGGHDHIELTLPDEGSGGPRPSPGAAPALASEPTAKQQYDHGVALLSARSYERAAEALGAFVVQWPEDPAVEGAFYGMGQAYLGKEELVEASEAFEQVLLRFPQGTKAAESLWALGMTAERLGNPERSNGYFERLARDFPKSEAARRIPAGRRASL